MFAIVNDKEFASLLKCFLFLAEPVVRLMRCADTAKPGSIGKIYKLSAEVQDNIRLIPTQASSPSHDFLKKLSDEVLEDIMARWLSRWETFHSSFHAAAYALDPEFAFNDAGLGATIAQRDSEIRTGLIQTLRKVLYDEDPARQCELVAQAMTEHTRFLEKQGLFGLPEVRLLASKVPAHEWWRHNGGETPTLQRAAKRILAQISSNSICERTWSAYDFIHSKRRNRLTAKRAEKLVKVYGHIKLSMSQREASLEDKNIPWHWWAEEELSTNQVDDAQEDGELSESAGSASSDDEVGSEELDSTLHE